MKVLKDYGEELKILQQHVRGQAVPGKVLRVLEAGCGREWYFQMDGIPYELTGIDMDPAALAARSAERGDLTHSIVGDLRTAQLDAGTYDVIYNAFVLEHVAGAEKVLENFVRWLAPGGVMIVRVPDRDSAQGFLARCTPHWFHVLYYRVVWKMKDAGKPGFAPYPTIYDDVVSKPGLRAFCARHGLLVREEIGVGSFRRGHGLLSKLTPAVARILSWVSFGRVHADFVDFSIVAQKPA